MLFAKSNLCKTTLGRPLEEPRGKGAASSLLFSHLSGGERKGWEPAAGGGVPSAALRGTILGSGITRSAPEGRYPARKKPAAAKKCRQGARAAWPPPG